jgi:A/G-specific adenine glycosylase
MSVLPQVVTQLSVWSVENGRHSLPWRKVGISPYEVWVSEIMLQQTQVSRVIPYYQRFLERFPTVKHLAEASWEEFLPYYAGLGYYARGRNMLKTAQTVEEKFHGVFPPNETALRSLPGVGPYTAKAILSFGFGEPHLAFDTNQQRVFGRVLHGDKKANLDTMQIEKEILRTTDFRLLNGTIMDFANAVCTKKPKCGICPLRKECRYFQTNGELEDVTATTKSRFPLTQAQVYLTLHRQHSEYFSANPEKFEPFRLPISLTSRAQIKEYFRRQYGLELSVRPPHKQGYLDEQPVLLVNAQILLGNNSFAAYTKEEAKSVLQELQANLLEE